MFVGTLSFEETGGLPERSDGETRAGGVGPPGLFGNPQVKPPRMFRAGGLTWGLLSSGGLDPAGDRGGPEGPARHPS